MKKSYYYVGLLAFIAVLVIAWGIRAETAAAGSAKVTFLSGKGFKSKSKDGPWTAIKKGSSISAGYYVKADTGSKIELTLPDNSKLRIAPNSVLFLSNVRLSKGTRTYDAKILSGTVYTKATPSKNKNDKFIVHSGGAVAGLRGTAFDIILMPDGDTQIKCFEGKVWVATWTDYVQRAMKEAPTQPTGSLEAHEVPGPGVVSEAEWVRIVDAMTSVTVGADGKMGNPSAIAPGELSDWEEWNRQRDAM